VTIHILGCGPAGLAAAHAAVILGHDIRIFSRNRKSEMYGAQYLHKPLPIVSELGGCEIIKYMLMGTADQYRRKVYGDDYTGTVSPEDLTKEHPAWDIREAYDRLWNIYSKSVEPVDNISPRWMLFNKQLRPMISSIPLPEICFHPSMCNFMEAIIWAAGEAPERGTRLSHLLQMDGSTVICNGLDNPLWYRASHIFDRMTIEWPWRAGPSAMTGAAVVKPIRNNCLCWPEVLKVGRYGKWEKGVLVHHAFEEAYKWLCTSAVNP
jgi:hypothetical protein